MKFRKVMALALAAAIAAGQQGAKVVVIEKNAEVGGDTLVWGAI